MSKKSTFKGRRKNNQNQQKFSSKSYQQLYDQCELCLGYMSKDTPTFGNQNLKTIQNMKLYQCQHKFHSSCIKNYLKFFGFSQIEENINSNEGFKCPIEECDKTLSIEDIGIALEVPNLQEWIQKMKTQKMMKCQLQYCQYMIVYNKSFIGDIQFPKCKITYDSKTKQIKTSLNNFNLEELSMLKQYGFVQCHKCNFWIQKNGGCDHMTCKCGGQICYRCGGIYGQCQCYKQNNSQNFGETMDNYAEFIEN